MTYLGKELFFFWSDWKGPNPIRISLNSRTRSKAGNKSFIFRISRVSVDLGTLLLLIYAHRVCLTSLLRYVTPPERVSRPTVGDTRQCKSPPSPCVHQPRKQTPKLHEKSSSAESVSLSSDRKPLLCRAASFPRLISSTLLTWQATRVFAWLCGIIPLKQSHFSGVIGIWNCLHSNPELSTGMLQRRGRRGSRNIYIYTTQV